jgi:hypothetical protein
LDQPDSFEVFPRSSAKLAVNVANGNLIYRANDLHIAGVGLDLGVSSAYNSLGPRGSR